MGNWKDLGVVPDSDDESFDSEDLQQPSTPHSSTHPQSTQAGDIWEFPGSSAPPTDATIVPHRNRNPNHKIQVSHATSSGPEPSQNLGEQQTSPLHSGIRGDDTLLQRIQESPDPLGGTPTRSRTIAETNVSQDAILPNLVRITARRSLFPGNPLGQDVPGVPMPCEIPEANSAQTPTKLRRPVPSQALPAFESPEQGRRSLRPRKPIQEHPYLLENAQYSRFMKTHGVKPVRVTVPQEATAVQEPGEDSQDCDYNGDDSQLTSGLPDEESQVEQRNTSNTIQEDDVDELALSPSPKTSSPHRHLRESSEHGPAQHTDDSSVSDDDEFPDIRDLLGINSPTSSKQSKRQLPAQPSKARKRIKIKQASALQNSPSRMPPNVWDIPSCPGLSRSQASETSPVSAGKRANPIVLSGEGSRTPSPQPETLRGRSRSPNALLNLVSGENGSEDEMASGCDDPAAESDSDLLRRTGKRIKGVLPASWLRLDQQTRKVGSRKTTTKANPSRDLYQKRPGLATRKFGPSKSTASVGAFLDGLNDDSEDNDTSATKWDDETTHPNHDRVDLLDDTDVLELDDGASVIEDDCVDMMLPGKKRRSDIAKGRLRKKPKTKQNLFKEPAQKRYQQPKISQSFHHSNRSSSGMTRTRRPGADQHNRRQTERLISPPELSIVDLIQPNAPNFLKIAARTAGRRKDMGRSEPSHKNIDLGNRTDNVDALSVLTDWRSGKLGVSLSMPRSPKRNRSPAESHAQRHPLRPLSTNLQRQSNTSNRLSFTQPKKLTRKMNIDHLTTNLGATPQLLGQASKPTKLRKSTSLSSRSIPDHRPAQLEDDMLQDTGVAFTARKKMLDLVFRKNKREVLAPTFKLQQPTTVPENMPPGQSESIAHAMHDQQHDSTGIEKREGLQSTEIARRRPRKVAVPRRLDLEAPQFRHANDPLPLISEPNEDEVRNYLQTSEQSKITGLGPFGTHYTQHFDIFPLHEDAYFHHSTLIGDGTLKKVLDFRSNNVLKQFRPSTSFDVFDHRFCWDAWTDTTSSELGLLFDLLTEKLEHDQALEDSASRNEFINCANYILRYILQSARFHQDSLGAFTQRLSNLLLGFLDSTKSRMIGYHNDRILQDINVRFLMCSLMLLRLCQDTGELSSSCLHAESIVQQYAKAVVQQLLGSGFSAVRSLYDDLQRLSTRERGIRNDDTLVISWVIVIKILGSAQISRAGFWDLTSSAMEDSVSLETNDARKFESMWEDMFTLLPLGEFDENGVLSKGMRHAAPLQGWSLPQKLLKRVFDSYQKNPKQSPGFNEYCRALLARCHYLIEQWGWHKCVGVVGSIFDFFGHRALSHLRNEEANNSPGFLEELSNSPCLSVQPGDRCFHVFLKILALAIQRLQRQGLSSDVRNLIARCLPNHNREYSKEQTVHFDDLASLRNHHDLLCTLFWSAPPEDRRPVTLIEKLVSPARSHREACLINLRAWSQLARFVVSAGGSIEEYRPFMAWQNNIFQEILAQYLTAATDVHQQYMSLAKEKRKDIKQHMLNHIIVANQTAAKDILYASVQASADVVKHCPSLASATFSFNVTQTNKLLEQFVNASIDLDWGILRACFDNIDLFVARLEELWHKLKQATDNSIFSHDSRAFEDAVDILDDKVVQSFFAVVRRALSSIPLGQDFPANSPVVVVEKAVILCGRIASLFIGGKKRQIDCFFSSGSNGLFGGLPHELGLIERKFVPLFVATLWKELENPDVFEFSSIGYSHFGIWTLALVKPFQALRYENYLAETLKKMDVSYMKGASVINGAAPTYDANRDFFACGISCMRRELLRTDVTKRKPLRAKHEKLLKLVMQQMKSDIKSLELNSPDHKNYISFVRDVVGLIKSHGADICTVDPFYYQVSAEYSPAKEDPQLHTAGILAYGLRLGEHDTRAIPQLFFYLYNHFKSSLANGQLEAEVEVVQNGMKDDNILAFVMGHMLPAIIQTSSRAPHVWPLLGIYSSALQYVVGRSCLPREIPKNQTDNVVVLLETIIDWFRRKSQNDNTNASRLTATDTHIFTELFKICNSIRPSLICWLLLPVPNRDRRVEDCLDVITALACSTITYLDDLRAILEGSDHDDTTTIAAPVHDEVVLSDFFTGWLNTINARFPQQVDGHVARFVENLERELRTNWVVTRDIITVKAAVTTSSSTQQPGGGQSSAAKKGGVKNDLDAKKTRLLSELLAELRVWVEEIGWGDEDHRNGCNSRRRRRPRRFHNDTVPIDRLLYGV